MLGDGFEVSSLIVNIWSLVRGSKFTVHGSKLNNMFGNWNLVIGH